MRYIFGLAALALTLPHLAWADNIAKCEVVLMENIEDESGNGGASVASYRPAGDFLESVFVDDVETLREIDGLAIRALMCERRNWVPSDADYKILATGVPLALSPSFDSTDAWVVTYYYKDGAFRHNFKGVEMPADAELEIVNLLNDFTGRDHGLDPFN